MDGCLCIWYIHVCKRDRVAALQLLLVLLLLLLLLVLLVRPVVVMLGGRARNPTHPGPSRRIAQCYAATSGGNRERARMFLPVGAPEMRAHSSREPDVPADSYVLFYSIQERALRRYKPSSIYHGVSLVCVHARVYAHSKRLPRTSLKTPFDILYPRRSHSR